MLHLQLPPACWTVLSDSLWAVTAAVCAGLQPRAQLSWKKTVAISFGISKRFFACLQLRLELVCLFTCCRCCCWAGGTYYARIWYAVWLWQLLPASFFCQLSLSRRHNLIGPQGPCHGPYLAPPASLSACLQFYACIMAAKGLVLFALLATKVAQTNRNNNKRESHSVNTVYSCCVWRFTPLTVQHLPR